MRIRADVCQRSEVEAQMNPISWIVFGGEYAGSASPAAAPVSSNVIASAPAANATLSNMTDIFNVIPSGFSGIGFGSWLILLTTIFFAIVIFRNNIRQYVSFSVLYLSFVLIVYGAFAFVVMLPILVMTYYFLHSMYID